MANNAKTAKSKALRGGWREQWRYAWMNAVKDMLRQPLATLLTVMVIAISLTLEKRQHRGDAMVPYAAVNGVPG